MSEESNFEKVRIYLKQELAEPFNKLITVKNSVIIISMPQSIIFNEGYTKLYSLIEVSNHRIRNREFDLNFTSWSPNQLRGFVIYR